MLYIPPILGLAVLLPFFQHARCAVLTSTLTSLSNRAVQLESMSNATNVNETQFGRKYPNFLANVDRGVNEAEIVAPALGLFQILSIKNELEPRHLPSSNLDYFTKISLVLVERINLSPAQWDKYDLEGSSTWGHWGELTNQMEVDKRTGGRGFKVDSVSMNDDDAQRNLNENGYRGPWVSYELCLLKPGGSLVYAFKRRQLPGRQAIYDVVRVSSGETSSISTYDRSFCPSPLPITFTASNGTTDSTDSADDPTTTADSISEATFTGRIFGVDKTAGTS